MNDNLPVESGELPDTAWDLTSRHCVISDPHGGSMSEGRHPLGQFANRVQPLTVCCTEKKYSHGVLHRKKNNLFSRCAAKKKIYLRYFWFHFFISHGNITPLKPSCYQPISNVFSEIFAKKRVWA